MKRSLMILSIFAILGAVILICGCLGVTVHTTVNSQGKITEVSTEMNMSQTNYDLFASIIQMSSPGTDMESYFVNNYSKSYGGPGTKIDYKETRKDGYVRIMLTASGTDVQPLEGSNVTVTRDGDYWVYRYITTGATSSASVPMGTSASTLSDSMANMITLDFYLTMPGKIIDTNAQIVNGNKAEWHYNMKTVGNISSLYAKSDVAKSPGFGTALALIALAAGVYLAVARKKE